MDGLDPIGGSVLTKVLLTGSAGFIGTTLAESFSAYSWQVAGLDLAPPKESFPGQTDYICDLRNRDQYYGGTPVEDILRLETPDAVVHMAAQARVDPSLADPFGTYDTNVLATLNLAKAVSKMTGHKPLLIYASSESVYGQARIYPTPENNDFNPISPYASSKIACDVMLQQLCGRLGMRTCVLRSGMGMGPRSDPRFQVISKFIGKTLENKPLMFPAGENVRHPTRDINPVQNFAEGVRLVIEAKATGVYNIASGRELSILDAARKILDAVGKSRSMDLSHLLRFEDGYSYSAGEEGMRTWLSIEKAKKELGYEPRLTFEDALGPTVEWLRRNKNYWGKPD